MATAHREGPPAHEPGEAEPQGHRVVGFEREHPIGRGGGRVDIVRQLRDPARKRQRLHARGVMIEHVGEYQSVGQEPLGTRAVTLERRSDCPETRCAHGRIVIAVPVAQPMVAVAPVQIATAFGRHQAAVEVAEQRTVGPPGVHGHQSQPVVVRRSRGGLQFGHQRCRPGEVGAARGRHPHTEQRGKPAFRCSVREERGAALVRLLGDSRAETVHDRPRKPELHVQVGLELVATPSPGEFKATANSTITPCCSRQPSVVRMVFIGGLPPYA